MILHFRAGIAYLSGTAEKGQDREDQEDDEENLCNAGGSASNAAKTQYRRDDRDNQKNQCVMKHGVVLLNGSQSWEYGQPQRQLIRLWSAIHP